MPHIHHVQKFCYCFWPILGSPSQSLCSIWLCCSLLNVWTIFLVSAINIFYRSRSSFLHSSWNCFYILIFFSGESNTNVEIQPFRSDSFKRPENNQMNRVEWMNEIQKVWEGDAKNANDEHINTLVVAANYAFCFSSNGVINSIN